MMLCDIIVSRNRALIEAVELTDLEKEEALFERKKKKYFREKNAEHWSNQEQKKGKTEVTKMI